MKKNKMKLIGIRRKVSRKDSGLTLLEYCAGAAVLAGAVFAAFTLLGGSLNTSMQNIGNWAVTNSNPTPGNFGNNSGN